jgi:hypothetical protein
MLGSDFLKVLGPCPLKIPFVDSFDISHSWWYAGGDEYKFSRKSPQVALEQCGKLANITTFLLRRNQAVLVGQIQDSSGRG